ncbi:methyltransferase family protein [Palleronia aestuarii]|uniref:Methyltransferase family protein n=2 Tax=Palleronia aestuarii TaxID=568105 RepID=A0A2W7NSW6_9RHOB|nr:methyltransferase family protein [Palleronia aestuarii]
MQQNLSPDPAGAVTQAPASRMAYARRAGSWQVEQLFRPDFEAALVAAEVLAVLDPVSFAWEAYERVLERVVVYLVIPPDLPAGDLTLLFGGIADGLSVFDRIVVQDEAQYRALRARVRPTARLVRHDAAPVTAEWCFQDFDRRAAASGVFGENGRLVSSRPLGLAANKRAHLEQMRVLRPALDRIDPGRDWSAVEWGCGAGRVLSECADRGARLTGIERDERLLETCRADLDGVTAIPGDVTEAAGIGPGRYDLSLLVNLLHFLDPEGQRRALAHALAATRQGGALLVVMDHVADPEIRDIPFHPASVRDAHALFSDVAGSGLVLEEFRTIAHDHCDEIRSGLSLLRKIAP